MRIYLRKEQVADLYQQGNNILKYINCEEILEILN